MNLIMSYFKDEVKFYYSSRTSLRMQYVLVAANPYQDGEKVVESNCAFEGRTLLTQCICR